jgi:hypothetical protein
MFAAALLVAAALVGPQPDPVLDYYRGVWHCDGTNFRHRAYSLTYRYTADPNVPPQLRIVTVYFVGKRRAVLSGQLARTESGTYIETGARNHDMWVAASPGWRGDTMTWADVMLPGGAERDRTTVRRISADAFTALDQRLGADGKPNRTNTSASCRRISR